MPAAESTVRANWKPSEAFLLGLERKKVIVPGARAAIRDQLASQLLGAEELLSETVGLLYGGRSPVTGEPTPAPMGHLLDPEHAGYGRPQHPARLVADALVAGSYLRPEARDGMVEKLGVSPFPLAPGDVAARFVEHLEKRDNHGGLVDPPPIPPGEARIREILGRYADQLDPKADLDGLARRLHTHNGTPRTGEQVRRLVEQVAGMTDLHRFGDGLQVDWTEPVFREGIRDPEFDAEVAAMRGGYGASI